MSTLATVEKPAALAVVPNVETELSADTPANEPEQPIVVECPMWCERGQEHDNADDLEHWTHDREIDGPTLMASLINDGGCDVFEVRLGEHTTLKLNADQAGRLIGGLAELMALSTRKWKKKITLPIDDGGDPR